MSICICIEQCAEGWVIAGGRFNHNHELAQDIGSSLAEAAHCCIPKMLVELGDTLKHAGLTASKINQALESEARRQGLHRCYLELSGNLQ